MKANWQSSVINERGRDAIYRFCLSGKNQWSEIFRAMHESGFIPADKGGWPLRNYIQPMLDSGEIVRLSRGQYFATCPHCHTPILNVPGAPH